jgi:hypothetical protein
MEDLRFIIASVTLVLFLVSFGLAGLERRWQRLTPFREVCDAAVGIGAFIVAGLWIVAFLLDGN